MSKYKYYFRKPKSEIVKDILNLLIVGGAICIAVPSPYFLINLLKNFKRQKIYNYKKKKIYDAFYNLQKSKCIKIDKKGRQFYVSLTEKGRKKAGWMQINDLAIKKPRKWDKKWYIVIFDISQNKKFYRELIRGKLKELEFYPLQKSVWVHPFNCRDEIELLRIFFGLSEKDIRLIVAEDIGNDNLLKEGFELK